jgi:hypothetical protein
MAIPYEGTVIGADGRRYANDAQDIPTTPPAWPGKHLLSSDIDALVGEVFPPTTEVVTITRTATGGTVDITLDGETVTEKEIIAATTAAQVKTAIVSLPNVASADLAVTGSAGGPYTVTWSGGVWAEMDVPELIIDDTNATGGTVLAVVGVPGQESPTGLTGLVSAVADHEDRIDTLEA